MGRYSGTGELMLLSGLIASIEIHLQAFLTIGACVNSCSWRLHYDGKEGFYMCNWQAEILLMLCWAGVAGTWTWEDMRPKSGIEADHDRTVTAVTALSYIIL
jgi:hypothetical protein